MSDKPPPLRLRAALTAEQIAAADDLFRKRLQAMQAVDELVAALVADLEASGKLADTLFIFTSDNGFHLGQHRLPEGKGLAYEEDIRVPFYARGPGIVAGAGDDAHLVANIDLAPTLAQIAGAQVPDFVDGRSFAWLLGQGEPPAQWRQALLVEQYPLGAPDSGDPDPLDGSTDGAADLAGSGAEGDPADPDPASVRAADAGLLEPIEGSDRLLMAMEPWRPRGTGSAPGQVAGIGQSDAPAPLYIALRDARYTYMEHRSGATELYDNPTDPYQLESQARRAPAAQLAALSAWTRALFACAGEVCRRVEDEGPGGAATATVTVAPLTTTPSAEPTASGTPFVPPPATPTAADGRHIYLPLLVMDGQL